MPLQNIYTRALNDAAAVHGGTTALAALLRVPEGTLLRWQAGRAMMPLLAFFRLLEILAEAEKQGTLACVAPELEGKVSFTAGELLARCARCNGTEFVPVPPEAPARYTRHLACCVCGEQATQAELVARLAKDVARATAAARAKRSGAAAADSRPG